MNKKIIYTTNQVEYLLYICNLPLLSKTTKLDELIKDFEIVQVEDVKIPLQ
jgi:hypothetical protein